MKVVTVIIGIILTIYFTPVLPLLRVTWFGAPSWGKVLIFVILAAGLSSISVIIFSALWMLDIVFQEHGILLSRNKRKPNHDQN